MPIVLSDILTPTEATALFEAAAALRFEDGKRTAGRDAATVKQNLQAAPGPEREAVLEKARTALAAHPGFQAVAYPRAFAGLMVSRTETGGGYGTHVDNALMAGQRADVSFTLALSPSEIYAGGALCVGDRVEDRAFRPGAGDAVIYPSDTLHRVAPVTQGTRLVVVGWVQSWVADPRQRAVLFDLWQAHGRAKSTGDAVQALVISKSRSNLLRMWAA